MSEKVLMRKIKKREKIKLTKLKQRKEQKGKSVETFEVCVRIYSYLFIFKIYAIFLFD